MAEDTRGPFDWLSDTSWQEDTKAPDAFPHPLHGRDLYTPLTTDIMDLLYRLKVREGSWRRVAYLLGMRVQDTRGSRELRKLRAGKMKAISMTTLDKMLTCAQIGMTVDDFTWFTPEDLVALGIWAPNEDLSKHVPKKKPRKRASRK